MNKITNSLLSICLLLSFSALAQNDGWNKISSDSPSKPVVNVSSISLAKTSIDIVVPGYHLKKHVISGADYFSVELQEGIHSLQKGFPDMDIIPVTLAIPNTSTMEADVILSDFVEYKNLSIAPSKGNIYRNVNPADLPFKFNACYGINQFTPQQQLSLRDPFIIRDFRGQTLIISPFQYNPVTHTLRVYTHLKLEV
ncbi:MAG TPA: C25 family peptidase propeptide domain-containing protein, partial [Bacteroidia bacterium]|nr:C25 family peptidase propeptide domain-containing protein [Bacteroidia bacterium]